MPELKDLRTVRTDKLPEPDQQDVSLFDDEKKELDNQRLRLYNQRLEAEINDLTQDRDQRKTYANRLYWLIVGWLIVVGLIMLLHGLSPISFKLSVTVLTTLIGSTTISVLGLFVIVANYLFPKRP